MMKSLVGLFAYPHDPTLESLYEGLESAGFAPELQVPNVWNPGQARQYHGVVVATPRCLPAIASHYQGRCPVVAIDRPLPGAEGRRFVRRLGDPWTAEPKLSAASKDKVAEFGWLAGAHRRVKGMGILIAGSSPEDPRSGVSAEDYRAWVESSVTVLRGSSDSRLAWLPHPDLPRWGPEGVEFVHRDSLAEELERSWLCVTWDAEVGFQALLMGMPVVASGPCPWKDACSPDLRGLSDIRATDGAVVEAVLMKIASQHLALEEIRSGALFEELIAGRPRNPEGNEEYAPEGSNPAPQEIARRKPGRKPKNRGRE